jgi:stage V sporulation protein G
VQIDVKVDVPKSIGGSGKLLCYAQLILDGVFVIENLRLIRHQDTGKYHVAMPSRPLADHCPACNKFNCLQARYCNWCGRTLAENRAAWKRDGKEKFINGDGRPRLYEDLIHPICAKTRWEIEDRVIAEYERYLETTGDTDEETPGPSAHH